MLRGRQNADGSRSKTWEELPNANAADYTPPSLSEEQGRAIEQRNLAQIRGLTSGENSGKMESKGIIEDSKISDFFLKPNAKHSQDFFGVGYSSDDSELLRNDLLAALEGGKRVDETTTKHGKRFSVFCELGITQKKRFRTVWQIENSNGIPRIITAHREDDDK